MIVLSLFGFRKNKVRLCIGVAILLLAMIVLLLSLGGERTDLDVVTTSDTDQGLESLPSRGESYPGEPVRVLGSPDSLTGPEEYWSFALETIGQ